MRAAHITSWVGWGTQETHKGFVFHPSRQVSLLQSGTDIVSAEQTLTDNDVRSDAPKQACCRLEISFASHVGVGIIIIIIIMATMPYLSGRVGGSGITRRWSQG
jgi:hypothetical protein